jgi:hypothetical protein
MPAFSLPVRHSAFPHRGRFPHALKIHCSDEQQWLRRWWPFDLCCDSLGQTLEKMSALFQVAALTPRATRQTG